jgi:hypothetical protein
VAKRRTIVRSDCHDRAVCLPIVSGDAGWNRAKIGWSSTIRAHHWPLVDRSRPRQTRTGRFRFRRFLGVPLAAAAFGAKWSQSATRKQPATIILLLYTPPGGPARHRLLNIDSKELRRSDRNPACRLTSDPTRKPDKSSDAKEGKDEGRRETDVAIALSWCDARRLAPVINQFCPCLAALLAIKLGEQAAVSEDVSVVEKFCETTVTTLTCRHGIADHPGRERGRQRRDL